MKANPCSPRAVRIRASAHALPSRCVSSAMLDQQLGLRSGTVQRKGGVSQRWFAADDEHAAHLGAQAARRALAAAGLQLADIDCLVVASGTLDQGMPCNAALVHRELGMHATPAFDINASCLGFLTALDHLSWPLLAGRYQRVLLVCADLASLGLDWQHLEASAIFGDGAAAAVLEASAGESGILASRMQTFSTGAEFCRIPAGGTRFHPRRVGQAFQQLALFHMDGKAVFRLVAQHLADFMDSLLADAGLTLADIDWVVPHQASAHAMQHLARRLGIRRDRIIDIFAEHGNQVAASLPTALDIGVRDGRIRRGHRLLLLGTGAGVSLNGMVMVY